MVLMSGINRPHQPVGFQITLAFALQKPPVFYGNTQTNSNLRKPSSSTKTSTIRIGLVWTT
jgi:hypothetical protein